MSGYRWLWVAWIAAFLGLELTAIIRRRFQDTLSEFVWHLTNQAPGNTFAEWTAIHFFVLVFLLWLLIHLGFGYLR